MGNKVIRAARNLVKMIYWKCRYGNRVQADRIQGFDRISLEMSPSAHLKIGSRNQNRGTLHLVCEGEGRLEIGSHVFYNTGACISVLGHIKIGDYCKFGNNLVIVDHDHNYRSRKEEYLIGEVTIGDRVWIGANCTILRGASIGNDCVIAAGSVVKGNVPAGTVFYQKRTDVIRNRERYE